MAKNDEWLTSFREILLIERISERLALFGHTNFHFFELDDQGKSKLDG